MGLPEKVALIIVCITIKQIIFTSCSSGDKAPSKNYSNRVKQKQNVDPVTNAPIVITLRPRVRSGNVKNKQNPNRNKEELRKNFNFPDIEYPSASTPRPPFYLQETNILQKKPVQRAAEYPTSTTVQYAINNKQDKYKINSNSKQTKTKKRFSVTITLPEFGTTPKPYCFRDGDFPDVEYPLSAKDTWKPNYWKPIPGGSTNDITKSVPGDVPKPTAKKNDTSLNRVSITARINPFTNSQSKKRNSNQNQVSPASSAKKNKKTGNNNKHATAKIGQNDLIKIDIHTSTPRSKTTQAMKNKHQNYDYTTSSTTQSKATESAIPNGLTPFTTLYFDTTPAYPDTISSWRDERESTTPSPKTAGRKKKTKKKNSLTKQTKNNKYKNDSSASIANFSSFDTYENQIDSLLLTQSSLTQCPVTPLPNEQDRDLTNIGQITERNVTNTDASSHICNETDICDCTSPCHTSSINPTPTSQMETHNVYKTPISIDNKVVSITDAINTIVTDNRDNEVPSRFEDNVTNCHKSVTHNNSTNDSLSCRADANDLPSADEEFTTDVFPDFDEDALGASSTLSPMSLSSVDEAWANSEVIDSYMSVPYPDELEQYYIMVP